MKLLRNSIVLITVFSLFFSIPVMGESNKFRVEIFGGISSLSPSDLNQHADYYNQWLHYYTESRYQFMHSVFGDNYTYSGSIQGELKRISNGFPFGMRVKYAISRSLSLSLGFQYISRKEESNAASDYNLNVALQDNPAFPTIYNEKRFFSNHTLFVEGYSPTIGIHLSIKKSRVFHLEAYAAGGPLFGKCELAFMNERLQAYQNGFWRGSELYQRIDGSGTGLALEVGAQLYFSITKRLEFFIEGSYAYMRVKELTGDGFYQYRNKDANAQENIQEIYWSGTWGLYEDSYTNSWGEFNRETPALYADGTTHIPGFQLDLSGFRVKAGLSFRF